MTDQLSSLERMTTAGERRPSPLSAPTLLPPRAEEMHGRSPALPIVFEGERFEAFSSTPSLARFGRAGNVRLRSRAAQHFRLSHFAGPDTDPVV